MNPALDLDDFFAGVRLAPERALLLDFDGTLAPFRSLREQVATYEGVDAFLQGLVGRNCRVVLVSGRGARDLESQWRLPVRPEMWGSHGLERLLPDGELVTRPVGEHALGVLAAERERLAMDPEPLRFEFKPYGIALHTRGLDAARALEVRTATRSRWSSLTEGADLRILEFDGGLEIHASAASKGTAVRTLLAEMTPEAVAAFLGDDRTDEDAFDAIHGRGLAVLVRPELRPTAADIWIEPPHELLEFLDRWTQAVDGERS
jgi:trehalose 6-phosphate phosphatase